MTPNCSQPLSNGQRCSAPAINGSKFCRHHDPQRPPRPVEEKTRETEPLALPPLLDKPSILAALNEVLHALAEGRIKRSAADTLLSGIKLAHRLLNEIAEAGETVLPVTGCSQPKPVALAASSDRPKPDTFNPARRYTQHSPAYSPDVDPDTARIVKELLAQSHELAKSQTARS